MQTEVYGFGRLGRMTLTTHAVVGAAVAQVFPQWPVAAFCAGFVSHLVIDSLPHWDYRPKSIKKDPNDRLATDMVIGRQFFIDLTIIASDAIFGVLLSVGLFSLWIFHAPLSIVLIGAMAGQLPDALQFVYFKTRSRLLLPLQRLHTSLQRGKSLYIPPLLGVSLQAALVAVIMLLEKFALLLP